MGPEALRLRSQARDDAVDTLMTDSSESESHYTFRYASRCDMCGASKEQHRVLGKRLNRSQGRSPRAKTGVSVTVVQCARCRLIFPNPLPIPRSIQDHYCLEPEEYWQREYFVADSAYFSEQIKRFNSLFVGNGPGRALDIGAGTGKCLTALESAGFDAFGLEGSELFHRAAIERNGIRPDRIRLSAVEDATFEPESFEFITFGAVLEHLYDPSEAIAKALNWLTPTGLIHIEVPSADWLIARLANFYYRLWGTDYVANLSPMHPPYHLYEFTLDTFRHHSQRLGYQIAHHEYYVAQTYLPRALDPVMRKVMEITRTGMQLEVWLRKDLS
jgi:SAM-dependent methyltransferase